MPESKKKGHALLHGGATSKLLVGFDSRGEGTRRDAIGIGRSSPEWLGSLEAARPTFGARSNWSSGKKGMEWGGSKMEKGNPGARCLAYIGERAELREEEPAWAKKQRWRGACFARGARAETRCRVDSWRGVHAAWLEATGGRASGRCGRELGKTVGAAKTRDSSWRFGRNARPRGLARSAPTWLGGEEGLGDGAGQSVR